MEIQKPCNKFKLLGEISRVIYITNISLNWEYSIKKIDIGGVHCWLNDLNLC